LSPAVRATLQAKNGVLKEIHTGQVSATTVRVSLEVQQLGTYRATALRYPDQVVIYLTKGTTERRVSLPPSAPPLSNPQANPSDTRRYRIMLDPGHGGADPGAEGINGLEEKTVVLAISQRLAKKLQERLAVDVLFTRTTDVFIPLEGRTARANTAKADLFISIHANASTNPELQGIETYYLNNTDDRATIRLAKLENGIREKLRLQQRGSELAFILSDLIQTGKEDASIALAEALQQSLVSRARTHYAQVRNLGVKKGPFYVLVGAHMPCVLVETAFLTHPREGKYLGAAAYQEALAEGLFRGIAQFLRTELMAKNL
jgi:N-acetylmuramoyl-L-alanine amidase